MSNLGIDKYVRQIQKVSEDDLPSVYAAADVVVMPSLLEGFGFPVLEAFAVGVPVAASRNWSLRDFPDDLLESAGSGGPEELEGAVRKVLDDMERSRARAARARAWARQWTWERVARGAARAYGARV